METIKYFTSNELQSLFKACISDSSKHSLRNLCLLKVAFYCGLRASELGLINVDDYNSSNRSIYCRRLKGSNNNMPSLLRQVKIGVVYVCVFNIFKVRPLRKQENRK